MSIRKERAATPSATAAAPLKACGLVSKEMMGIAESTVRSESGSTHSCSSSARAMLCCQLSLVEVRPSSTPAASDMAWLARTGGRVTTRSRSEEGSCSAPSKEPKGCTFARGQSCAASALTRAIAAWWSGRSARASAAQAQTKCSTSACSAEYIPCTGAIAAAAAACASTAAAPASCAESMARCAPVSCGVSEGMGRSAGGPSAPSAPPSTMSTPHSRESASVMLRSCASSRLQLAR
mmetsp:Transcript_3178/g.7837  ORF Transcript_3178/g.7837 Transcript_3178/m.7837 type:complete len:237 (+) Transcript_3178:897-1607(+)